jgi:hypothetical protein
MPEITVAPAGVGSAGAAGAGAGAGVLVVVVVPVELGVEPPELPAGAVLVPELELPEFVAVGFDEPALVEETALPAEKGFAPPDPQPTTEATATTAAPIFKKTLEAIFNLNPSQTGNATD